jgi:Zn-dependent protease
MDDGFSSIFVKLLPFIIAVVFHEVAHGWMANRWGDDTALRAGRITLNPIPHIDPIWSILFPALMFLSNAPFLLGGAKPVPINPGRFKKYRPGLFWVSFAGPGMNLILAIISSFSLCFILRFFSQDFYLFEPLAKMARYSVMINIALAVFNLIPIPPLDGSKILLSFLSYENAQKYAALERFGFIILFGLLYIGFLKIPFIPIQFLDSLFLAVAYAFFGLGTVM